MENPWGDTCLLHSGEQVVKFEDNFVTGDRLPDSQEYLEKLERKLAKLKKRNPNNKELLKALSETKKSHLERIVDSESSEILNDPDLDRPIVSSKVQRLIAPERQANTISELCWLIKYDQLGQLFEALEEQKPEEDGGR